MDPWLIWLIAAVIFAVGEIATLGFFLAPFAGGALVAAVIAAVGAGAVVSWASFIAVSLVLLLGLRPIAISHRRMPAQLRTGTAALVGRTAMVTERVANRDDSGCIKLEGESWTARAYDEDEVIQPGTRVQVMEIRGATALVTED